MKTRPKRPGPIALDGLSSVPLHQDSPFATELPVRKTFIDFASSPSRCVPQPLCSAPAWMGPSIRVVLNSSFGVTTSMRSPPFHQHAGRQQHASDAAKVFLSPGSSPYNAKISPQNGLSPSQLAMAMGAPKTPEKQQTQLQSPANATRPGERLPAVKYNFSPTSARAAGLNGNVIQTPLNARPLSELSADHISRAKGVEHWGDNSQNGVSNGIVNSRLQEEFAVRKQSTTTPEEDGSSSGDDSSSDDGGGRGVIYSAEAPLPSVGSAGHGAGNCKRCCFFPKGRCMNGENCEFCHFDHEKRKRKAKKKKKKKSKGRDLTSGNRQTSTRNARLQSPVYQQYNGQQINSVNLAPQQVPQFFVLGGLGGLSLQGSCMPQQQPAPAPGSLNAAAYCFNPSSIPVLVCDQSKGSVQSPMHGSLQGITRPCAR